VQKKFIGVFLALQSVADRVGNAASVFWGVNNTESVFLYRTGGLPIQNMTLFFNQNTIRLNEWAKQEVI